MKWLLATTLTMLPSAAAFGWSQVPGCAVDVGVGSSANAVWVIGCGREEGGYGIYQFNGSDWNKIPGSALRVAVDPSTGQPWVVNSLGNIFRRDFNWTLISGCAKDIAVASNGLTWVIGCDIESGGYGIHYWDGTWHKVQGSASRIAVEPSGRPWVVNNAGTIFRRNDDGNWQAFPGCARDITVDQTGSPWVIGCDATSGGYGIYQWGAFGWENVPGGAVNISVQANGIPWVTNNIGNIYRY